MIFATIKHYRIPFKIGWDFALTCNKLGYGVLKGLTFVVPGVCFMMVVLEASKKTYVLLILGCYKV